MGWGGFKFVLSRVIAKNLLKTIDLTDPGGGGRAPLPPPLHEYSSDYRLLEKIWRKQEMKNYQAVSYKKSTIFFLRISSLGKKNKSACKLCEVRDSIDLYENILFRFVKGEIKGGKGPNR